MKTNSPILFILLAILLVSCKKQNQEAGPPASFSFKTTTKDYSWNFEPDSPRLEKGARLLKTINPNTNNIAYVLDAWSKPDGISIACYLNTPVLNVSSYKTITDLSDQYVQGFSYINNIQYVIATNDYTSVTISNITGNYASGYFYAVMHDFTSGTVELRFYEGYFNHILIQN